MFTLLKLPSQHTLRDYTHYFKSVAGFNPDINLHLQREVDLQSLPESGQYVALVIDKMKLKDLVYIGFTSLSDDGDTLAELEDK